MIIAMIMNQGKSVFVVMLCCMSCNYNYLFVFKNDEDSIYATIKTKRQLFFIFRFRTLPFE